MITINGTIQANGGRGGASSNRNGGGGSGGEVHLLAPTVDGTGVLNTLGGISQGGITTRGGFGAKGRIRIEAFSQLFTGTNDPIAILRRPFGLFLPETPAPSLRVVSVGGIPLTNPTASFSAPDIEINTTAPIDIEFEAQNVPITSGDPVEATLVQLHIVSENQPDQIVDSTPLAGDDTSSTATVTATLPSGFSRAYVHAKWMQ